MLSRFGASGLCVRRVVAAAGGLAAFIALFALPGGLAAGCKRRGLDSAPAPEEAAAPPPALVRPPTLSAETSLWNLSGEIADREKRAEDVDVWRELVPRYLLRAQFAGRVADLEAADAVSARLVAARAEDARAHLIRAGALSAIHEFSSALQEVDRAAERHAAAAEVVLQRASIGLAIGREDDAALALGPPTDSLSPPELVLRGAIDARLGRAAESDALFERARVTNHDVTPFAVAWIDFERSRALEIAGDRARARAYLAEAVAVLPSYAHAATHLAAQEPPDAALSRLKPLETTSDDPEVLAVEADVLRRAGRSAEARAAAAQARGRYEAVLARLPRAFADHAARFYLGPGADAGRALVLSRANAENRPTDEALELWLTAA
ncbi:MAG: hypothetical protein JOZ69_16900, partial [Myxococcales bacterium]|nr:hypothetical protein [Myxococcales bacterium]